MQCINYRHDHIRNRRKKYMFVQNNIKEYLHELILQGGIALEIRENESL